MFYLLHELRSYSSILIIAPAVQCISARQIVVVTFVPQPRPHALAPFAVAREHNSLGSLPVLGAVVALAESIPIAPPKRARTLVHLVRV